MKIILKCVLALFCIIIIVSSTTSYVAAKEENLEVDFFDPIQINGVEQWVSIQSQDTSNPILLFVHGGPGSPETFSVRKHYKLLRKHFTLVTWDQRGSGRSYSRSSSPENINLEQIISDTYRLIQILKERFNKEKIYLVGHSWGSKVGIYLVQKHPEDFHAYIGVGQVVDSVAGELISYNYVLEAAHKDNNHKAIRQLEEIGKPIEGRYEGGPDALNIQRKWLMEYNGVVYGESSTFVFVKDIIFSKDSGLLDLYKFVKGLSFTQESYYFSDEKDVNVNLFEQVPRLEVPTYFFVGKYDYNVPFELTEEYYKMLKAPHKDIIWFNKSAHCLNFTEATKFQKVIIEKVLEETYSE